MNAFAHRVYYIPSANICQPAQNKKIFFVQGVDKRPWWVYNAIVQRQWRLWAFKLMDAIAFLCYYGSFISSKEEEKCHM